MPGPMKPSEVRAWKTEGIPEPVFEVSNRLIAEAWDGRMAIFAKTLAATLVAKSLSITEQEVYNRHLLNVEESYRAEGWDVEYDRPAYNETYDATFTFKIGKR